MHDCAGTQQKLMDVCLGELPVGEALALLSEVERCEQCAQWRREVEAALSRVDEALVRLAPAAADELASEAALRRRMVRHGIARFWYGAAGLAAAAGLALWFVAAPAPGPVHVALPVATVERPAVPPREPPRRSVERSGRLSFQECQSWLQSAAGGRASSEEPDKKATSDVVQELMGFEEMPPGPSGGS